MRIKVNGIDKVMPSIDINKLPVSVRAMSIYMSVHAKYMTSKQPLDTLPASLFYVMIAPASRLHGMVYKRAINLSWPLSTC